MDLSPHSSETLDLQRTARIDPLDNPTVINYTELSDAQKQIVDTVLEEGFIQAESGERNASIIYSLKRYGYLRKGDVLYRIQGSHIDESALEAWVAELPRILVTLAGIVLLWVGTARLLSSKK